MSMLHNTSHRPLFVPSFEALNLVIPYILCLFFGQTWNTYFFHHVKHHHVEDNGPSDLSSTESSQRDSLVHFLLYFFRFFLLIQLELTMYFVRRGRYAHAAKMLGGELFSLGLFATLAFYFPLPSLFVFVVPFLLMRFFMMVRFFCVFVVKKNQKNNNRLQIGVNTRLSIREQRTRIR